MKKGLIGIIIIGIVCIGGFIVYNTISSTTSALNKNLNTNNNSANENLNTNNNSANENLNTNNSSANKNLNTNNSSANKNLNTNNSSANKNLNTNNSSANDITRYLGTYTLNMYPCFTINHLVSLKVNLAKTLTIEKNTFKNGNYIINNPYYYIFEDSDGHYIGGYGSNDLPNPLTILLVSSKPLSQDELKYSVNDYNSFIVQNNILLKISEENGKAQAYAYQK